MTSRRIRLDVSYDGTGFSGSQIQPEARTVAGTLKNGLEELLGQPVHLLFAGRTDAGVHADHNVCSFDAASLFPVEKLAGILNPRLPADLLIRSSREVDKAFHPRFDAVKRTYHYRVYHGTEVPVDRWRYTCQVDGVWDGELVRNGLETFLGRHDFSNFSRAGDDQDGAICDISRAELNMLSPGETVIVLTANRFLRNMICRIVGSLLDLNAGLVSLDQIRESLDGELAFKPKPAPPQGLTLMKVDYPEKE